MSSVLLVYYEYILHEKRAPFAAFIVQYPSLYALKPDLFKNKLLCRSDVMLFF